MIWITLCILAVLAAANVVASWCCKRQLNAQQAKEASLYGLAHYGKLANSKLGAITEQRLRYVLATAFGDEADNLRYLLHHICGIGHVIGEHETESHQFLGPDQLKRTHRVEPIYGIDQNDLLALGQRMALRKVTDYGMVITVWCQRGIEPTEHWGLF